MRERVFIEGKYRPLMLETPRFACLVSYVGNKSVPILRLYRFKEAFSLGLVNHLLDQFEAAPKRVVFDPFAGMGTTLSASMLRGLPSVGVEKLPVAAFVAQTLPRFLLLKPGCLASTFERLRGSLDNLEPAAIADDVSIMKIAFKEPTLTRLRKWETAIDTLSSPMREGLLFVVLIYIGRHELCIQ